jgi:hypothetical protein
MTAIAPVRHNRLFTEPAAQPFRNEIAPIVFNLLSDGSRSQTHRGVPPVDDQLMNVLTVGGQEQEVPPLVVADVQTSVLIHPLQQLLRLHPVQRDPQVAESPDQLLQVDLSCNSKDLTVLFLFGRRDPADKLDAFYFGRAKTNFVPFAVLHYQSLTK